MTDDVKALVAKLTAKQFTGRRTLGGGTIGNDGTVKMWGNEPIMELRNPDGPDAAAALTAQADEIARLRAALEWYANPEVYKPSPHGLAFDNRDLSYHALAALKAAQEVKA